MNNNRVSISKNPDYDSQICEVVYVGDVTSHKLTDGSTIKRCYIGFRQKKDNTVAFDASPICFRVIFNNGLFGGLFSLLEKITSDDKEDESNYLKPEVAEKLTFYGFVAKVNIVAEANAALGKQMYSHFESFRYVKKNNKTEKVVVKNKDGKAIPGKNRIIGGIKSIDTWESRIDDAIADIDNENRGRWVKISGVEHQDASLNPAESDEPM